MPAISIDYGTIQVFDDAVPKDIHERLLRASHRVGWQFGWRSRNHSARYWHHEISGGEKHNTEDVTDGVRKHPLPVFGRYLDWLRSDVVPEDSPLLRYYLNGHTYGTDGSAHTDTEREGELTLVLYLTPVWNPDFGGETVVFDAAGDIERAILPRPNRIAAFPSDRLHAPRPLSKLYAGLRVVLVAKFGMGTSGSFVRSA